MSLDPHIRDPLYKYDTHYPDRLSRIHVVSECPSSAVRRTKVMRPRVGIRYRTQPVTFDEIQEVDEDPETRNPEPSDMDGMKSSLTAFSKSMDGLVTADARASTSKFADNLPPIDSRSESGKDCPDQRSVDTNLPMGLANARRPKKRNVKQKVVAPD